MWMNLQNVLREGSQTTKGPTLCDCICMKYRNRPLHRNRMQIDGCQRERGGGNGEKLL